MSPSVRFWRALQEYGALTVVLLLLALVVLSGCQSAPQPPGENLWLIL